MDLHTDIKYLKGVGEKRASSLWRLGITNVGSLLYHFPVRYEDWRNISKLYNAPFGTDVCIKARVVKSPVRQPLKTKTVWSGVIDDGSERADIVFFSEYTAKTVHEDEEYLFFGRLTSNNWGYKSMWGPRVNSAENAPAFTPVYHLTSGVSSGVLSKMVGNAIKYYSDYIEDPIPEEIRDHYRLPECREALRMIHFPETQQDIDQARRRFIYEELFVLLVGIAAEGRETHGPTQNVIGFDGSGEFKALLPFELTGAQKRVIAECVADLRSGRQMSRLLQGDVGSGKTAVAASLIYTVCKNGLQAAVLAPTEVLARQHADTFSKFFENTGIRIALITGSTPTAQKKNLRAALSAGEIDLVIGTHAIITDGTKFSDLALVVTDEQHRFGVAQRAKILAKGEAVHSLVMSATPIPRTLGLMLYGDLDISILDERPAGRKPIKTYVVDPSYEARALAFIAANADAGRQSYIVCPAIEESESGVASAGEVYTELTQGRLHGYNVGLLHGKLKNSEKERVMSEFRDGKVQILVSTVVIEVGVDVPNATIMLIRDADRFGLAQLHQLRGRIGRGDAESHCILMSGSDSASARERLNVLRQTDDGFEIAEADLRQRGPGEFLGEKQSGMPKLRLADLMTNINVVAAARDDAQRLIALDPTLKNHPALAEKVRLMFETARD